MKRSTKGEGRRSKVEGQSAGGESRRSKVEGPIGKTAVIRAEGQQHIATVIDATPDQKAKRVRVQSPGPIQGNVLMPGGYVLVEFI